MTTETEVVQQPVIPEKSKGQIFKEKNGFSKTFKRNMRKAGFDSFDTINRAIYRKMRQNKKRKQK